MADQITDIHAHILPDLDDGPASMEETLSLLKSMSKSGIHRAFCTSHYQSPHFDVTLDQMNAAFEYVTESQSKNSILDVTLSLGAEVRLGKALEADLATNHIPTLGSTSYVLVEFNTPEISEHAKNLIYELQVRGYRPIMAHPERNLAIQQDERLIDVLRDEGILMQATAQCYLIENPTKHRAFKLAWKLLEQGKIDVIASDTHNVSNRPPVLVEAYNRIGIILDTNIVDTLIGNANAIWENKLCAPVPVKEKSRRGLFRVFTR